MEDDLDTAVCECGHAWLDHDPEGVCSEPGCPCLMATAP